VFILEKNKMKKLSQENEVEIERIEIDKQSSLEYKTKNHIVKSIVFGLPYIILAFDNFNNTYWFIFIPLFLIISALALNLIPSIFYALSYLFTKNKDYSKNSFMRSFNILFWFYMIFMMILIIFNL